jgi:epoxyqueuosine reductase
MGCRVFGCDACQEACPHNRGVPAGEAVFGAGPALSISEILAWRPEDWDAATRGRAIRRASYEMFLRNAIIAAGNSGDTSLVALLRAVAARRPELAAPASWAAGRLEEGV